LDKFPQAQLPMLFSKLFLKWKTTYDSKEYNFLKLDLDEEDMLPKAKLVDLLTKKTKKI